MFQYRLDAPLKFDKLAWMLRITIDINKQQQGASMDMETMAPPLSGPQFSAETISGITGSISIACWLVVFSPQIIENFRRRSGDGLSLSFLVIWLAGDVFNVLGAIFQHVLPTMLILAIYCIALMHALQTNQDTLADVILILQVLYYRRYPYRKRRPSSHAPGASHLSPATPLLNPNKPPPRPPPISTAKAGISLSPVPFPLPSISSQHH